MSTIDKDTTKEDLTIDEIHLLLSELLVAERAGAKTCRAIMRQTSTDDSARFIEAIRQDEVRYCDRLIQCLEHLNLPTHTRTGDFYEKCMAVQGYEQRLDFLNKGQKWVVKQLSRSLPLINNRYVFDILNEMLLAHERNVARTQKELASE